jgi:hypothetical protein
MESDSTPVEGMGDVYKPGTRSSPHTPSLKWGDSGGTLIGNAPNGQGWLARKSPRNLQVSVTWMSFVGP